MRGFTLVEIIVTLAIAAVLVGISLPGLMNLIREYRATSAINSIVGQIQLARSAAIVSGETVTLCPTGGTEQPASTIADREPRCGERDSWHLGSMLFIDQNRDGRFDSVDRLLRRFPSISGAGQISWRSFRNRSSLSILRNGLTNSQNGSFRYCPKNNDAHFARQAIVNRQARVRHARDLNGDGLREAPGGAPITCPR